MQQVVRRQSAMPEQTVSRNVLARVFGGNKKLLNKASASGRPVDFVNGTWASCEPKSGGTVYKIRGMDRHAVDETVAAL